jgi:hypothetical protein
MKLFQPRSEDFQQRHAELYAFYEIAYTMIDFLGALLFVFGSIFFFSEATSTLATWLFLFGSIFFAIKPTIHLARELHLARRDRYEKSAQKMEK